MARGATAKAQVVDKIKQVFGSDYIGEASSKHYVWANDGGERVIDAYDSMLCPDCDYVEGEHSDWYVTCGCCGTLIHRDHGFLVENEYLCENCYTTETFSCKVCGEIFYNEHKHYLEADDCFVCSDCYKDLTEE